MSRPVYSIRRPFRHRELDATLRTAYVESPDLRPHPTRMTGRVTAVAHPCAQPPAAPVLDLEQCVALVLELAPRGGGAPPGPAGSTGTYCRSTWLRDWAIRLA